MSSTMPKKHRPTHAPIISFDRTLIEVGHLMRRAAFGATPDQILQAATAGIASTVDGLVNYDQTSDTFTPPDQVYLDQKRGRIDMLAAWWVGRMLTGSRPFQEKMTLFWHGHFATGANKVNYPGLMYNQNQLFRQNALGAFDDILSAVTKDPAMVIWLDGQRNTKFAPNENYGREVMELFTLGRVNTDGQPNYSEDDVHGMARAFTGWHVDPTGQAIFTDRLHDDGIKTILGQTGNWNADDAVRILVNHPATGPWLASRLWKFFASDIPNDSVIAQLGQIYYGSNHSIRAMVLALFAMPEFYHADARQNHIKSPTEFVVTTLKQLGLTGMDTTYLPRYLLMMGQELFNPPNVGGWEGGANWVNASTMLTRFNFASRLTGNAPGSKSALDGQALVTASQADRTDQLLAYITQMLGVLPSATTHMALQAYIGRGQIDSVDAVTKALGLVHLTLVSPEYQIA